MCDKEAIFLGLTSLAVFSVLMSSLDGVEAFEPPLSSRPLFSLELFVAAVLLDGCWFEEDVEQEDDGELHWLLIESPL